MTTRSARGAPPKRSALPPADTFLNAACMASLPTKPLNSDTCGAPSPSSPAAAASHPPSGMASPLSTYRISTSLNTQTKQSSYPQARSSTTRQWSGSEMMAASNAST